MSAITLIFKAVLAVKPRQSLKPILFPPLLRSEQMTASWTPFKEAMWKPYSIEWAIAHRAGRLERKPDMPEIATAERRCTRRWYKSKLSTCVKREAYAS